MISRLPQNPLFEKALRAGTACLKSLDSRESDLDERMAKVAHLHVRFISDRVVSQPPRGWELIRRSGCGCSQFLLVFFPLSSSTSHANICSGSFFELLKAPPSRGFCAALGEEGAGRRYTILS